MRYARQARLQADDLAVQARAACVVGAETDDDDEWRDELLFAFQNGDHFTASLAALRYGMEVVDPAEAYKFLEAAFRPPRLSISAIAARKLAQRFAHEPNIAEHYARKAEELDATFEIGTDG